MLATGGYGNVFYLSTNAKGCNVTATWRAYKKGAAFANPCYTQIHPTCIPVSGDHQSKLTLMSESLRNDGRVWVPKKKGDNRAAARHSRRSERDYYLERKYPSFGNLAPRDISSRAAKEVCDEGRGVGPGGRGVYLDFADAIKRIGEPAVRERYGNLFDMYEKITGENAYQTPDAHLSRRALHHGRIVGGLQFDEHHARDFCAGRGEFFRSRRQPPRRQRLDAGIGRRLFCRALHASAIISPPPSNPSRDSTSRNSNRPIADVQALTKKLLAVNGKRTVNSFHKELGTIMWEKCGMARNEKGLQELLAANPRVARGILEERQSRRPKRGIEPEPGTRRARGRFSGIRRTALPGRARNAANPAAAISARNFKPRTARPSATTSNFAYVAAWEYAGAGPAADPEQGTAGL